MRIETTTRKLFKFDELPEDTKEKAIDALRYSEVSEYGWWSSCYDDAKMIGALIGIEIDGIYFSGFSSQGDGALFEGSYSYRRGWKKALKSHVGGDGLQELLDIGNALQAIQRKYFYGISASTRQSGHYNHSGCMEVSCSFEEHNNSYWNDTCEAEDEVRDQLRLFADWIYSMLEKEHDYLTSDDCVKESIESNDYEFTENGILA